MFSKGFSICRSCSLAVLGVAPMAVGAMALAGLMAGAASASTIYFDNFSGSTAPGTLNGAAPTVTTGSATWTADSLWSEGGYINSGSSARLSAYLPFTPVAGHIYTLSAGLEVTKETNPSDTGTGDYWFALGFMTSASTTQPWDAGGASPWVLNGLYASSGVNGVVSTGPALFGGQGFGGLITSGANNYSIVLDTVASTWTYNVYLTNSAHTNLLIGSSSAAPFSSNPVITDVGIQDGLGAGNVSNFSLTVVPEPASLGLLAVGGLGLLLLKRRKTA